MARLSRSERVLSFTYVDLRGGGVLVVGVFHGGREYEVNEAGLVGRRVDNRVLNGEDA